MPERSAALSKLEGLLQQAGIVENSTARLVDEIHDHYVDRVAEELDGGATPQQASAAALSAIGKPEDIAAVAAQFKSLQTVTRQHPLLAGLAHSFACVVIAPVVPVVYCAQRRDAIARWGLSTGVAALMMAGLLLSMQTLLGII